MIRIDEGRPVNVIVAVASGKVTPDDYQQTLLPALERGAASGDKLRFLYVLGADFEDYEASAALDDAKLGMQYWTAFSHIGLVTDHEAYRALARTFGFLMPGEVRVFSLAERSAAEQWITG